MTALNADEIKEVYLNSVFGWFIDHTTDQRYANWPELLEDVESDFWHIGALYSPTVPMIIHTEKGAYSVETTDHLIFLGMMPPFNQTDEPKDEILYSYFFLLADRIIVFDGTHKTQRKYWIGYKSHR